MSSWWTATQEIGADEKGEEQEERLREAFQVLLRRIFGEDRKSGVCAWIFQNQKYDRPEQLVCAKQGDRGREYIVAMKERDNRRKEHTSCGDDDQRHRSNVARGSRAKIARIAPYHSRWWRVTMRAPQMPIRREQSPTIIGTDTPQRQIQLR